MYECINFATPSNSQQLTFSCYLLALLETASWAGWTNNNGTKSSKNTNTFSCSSISAGYFLPFSFKYTQRHVTLSCGLANDYAFFELFRRQREQSQRIRTKFNQQQSFLTLRPAPHKAKKLLRKRFGLITAPGMDPFHFQTHSCRLINEGLIFEIILHYVVHAILRRLSWRQRRLINAQVLCQM